MRTTLSLAVLLAPWCALAAAPLGAQSVASTATAPFAHFESSGVHPLALSVDGTRLYAVNTPDERVEIYTVAPNGALALSASVWTGLEPVSLLVHPSDPNTLFVANQLSDDVAVVDLAALAVRALIPVGDEPRDLAFANGKLFASVARSAAAGTLVEPAGFVDNAVVVAQGVPPYAISARIAIPAHLPRGLAVVGSGAAARVYVVPQNSSNDTTVLDTKQAQLAGLGSPIVPDGSELPFAFNPALLAPGFAGFANTPFFNQDGWVMPATSRIVRDSEFPAVTTQLSDADLFAIDAASNALLPNPASGLGTTLFAVERNPATGALWIPNTDARNRTRFEPVLKGAAFENRISIVAPGGALQSTIELAPPLTSVAHAQPIAIAFYAPPRGSGAALTGAAGGAAGAAGSLGGAAQLGAELRTPRASAYIACLGSSLIVVLDAQTGARIDEIDAGLLPMGLAVDSQHARLYVLARGDHALRGFDIAHGHAPLGAAQPLSYDPEPAAVRAGRVHLYDARAASSHGTGNFSCASCHVFGHLDQLAWDLGDPEGGLGYFFPDLLTGSVSQGGKAAAGQDVMQTHPMKGPMTTQSLRGLSDAIGPPLHWRGDRRFFQMFQGAFEGLLGGAGITNIEMQQFAGFLQGYSYAPNPYQNRDRGYTGAAATGRTLFGLTTGQQGKNYSILQNNLKCITCHAADFAGKTNFTGSQRTVNHEGEFQMFNTAQLRGVYEKEYKELTGFGTVHDGSGDGTREFLNLKDLFVGLDTFILMTAADRDNLTEFVRRWDTGLAPLIGQQQLATAANAAQHIAWWNLAEAQAEPPAANMDLVLRVRELASGSVHGGVHVLDAGLWKYRLDDGSLTDRATLAAQVLAGTHELLLSGVPSGTGTRYGIDRDEDGRFDAQELAAGTNPAAADSDGDGYDDGLEASLGSNPLSFDASLPADVSAPLVQLAQPRDLFATTATLHVQLSEPASLAIEYGTAPGTYNLGTLSAGELRRVHDPILAGLPANTAIHFRVTAKDKNLNQGQLTGSFSTGPRLLHIDDIALNAQPSGAQWLLSATVKVVDQDGLAVPNCPVRGVWAGDIGGQAFFPTATTDANGFASFALSPYTPGAPTTVTFSPAYIGTTTVGQPFYVGSGGGSPGFYYQQPANKRNYRSVSIP